MKGTRPLTTKEIIAVNKQFTGKFEVRNRSLFMLGVSVGGRISELLALTIGDVWQNRQPITDLLFERRIVKGGEVSRTIPVNSDGRKAVSELITWHRERYGKIDPMPEGGFVSLDEEIETANGRKSPLAEALAEEHEAMRTPPEEIDEKITQEQRKKLEALLGETGRRIFEYRRIHEIAGERGEKKKIAEDLGIAESTVAEYIGSKRHDGTIRIGKEDLEGV